MQTANSKNHRRQQTGRLHSFGENRLKEVAPHFSHRILNLYTSIRGNRAFDAILLPADRGKSLTRRHEGREEGESKNDHSALSWMRPPADPIVQIPPSTNAKSSLRGFAHSHETRPNSDTMGSHTSDLFVR